MATKKTKQPAKLQEALVLFKYILNLFGCKDLAALSGDLKDPALEGVDDEGCSRMLIVWDDEGWRLNANPQKMSHILGFFAQIN